MKRTLYMIQWEIIYWSICKKLISLYIRFQCLDILYLKYSPWIFVERKSPVSSSNEILMLFFMYYNFIFIYSHECALGSYNLSKFYDINNLVFLVCIVNVLNLCTHDVSLYISYEKTYWYVHRYLKPDTSFVWIINKYLLNFM